MLSKTVLKAKILQTLNEVEHTAKTNENPAATKDKLADELADSIVEAVKSATITIPVGLIQVQGPSGLYTNLVPIIIEGGLT